jgi:hypothetical protein
VRGDVTLERLHTVFQKAMGWRDAHVHEWIVGDRRYGRPEPEDLLAAIRNPRHRDHKELLAWVGGRFEPEAFDLAAVSRKLRQLK